jgi:hypothetical protein
LDRELKLQIQAKMRMGNSTRKINSRLLRNKAILSMLQEAQLIEKNTFPKYPRSHLATFLEREIC